MKTRILLVILFFMFLFIVGTVILNSFAWQANAKSNSELIQAIGYSGPSLGSDCTYSRNPILEGTCQTDVPGGYCYHESCGMINPTAETPYYLKITHIENNTVG